MRFDIIGQNAVFVITLLFAQSCIIHLRIIMLLIELYLLQLVLKIGNSRPLVLAFLAWCRCSGINCLVKFHGWGSECLGSFSILFFGHTILDATEEITFLHHHLLLTRRKRKVVFISVYSLMHK